MSDFQGTPAPWSNGQFVGLSGQDHFGLNVGFVNTDSVARREECRANAALIAIAPELLAKLSNLEVQANTVAYCYDKRPENFAVALQSLKEAAEQAREIIAKATA